MRAVNWLTPYIPRLETEKVPPLISCSLKEPERARSTKARLVCEICSMVSCWQPCTTGISTPSGTPTAMPMFISLCCCMPPSAKDAFRRGKPCSAKATPFTTTSFTVSAKPFSLSWRRSDSASSMAISMVTLKCGMERQESLTVFATAALSLDMGDGPCSPASADAGRDGGASASAAGGGDGCAGWPDAAWLRSRSCSRIRPSGPLPSILLRSIPSSRALRRTTGAARSLDSGTCRPGAAPAPAPPAEGASPAASGAATAGASFASGGMTPAVAAASSSGAGPSTA